MSPKFPAKLLLKLTVASAIVFSLAQIAPPIQASAQARSLSDGDGPDDEKDGGRPDEISKATFDGSSMHITGNLVPVSFTNSNGIGPKISWIGGTEIGPTMDPAGPPDERTLPD